MNEKTNYYLLVPIVLLLFIVAFSWLRRETVHDNGTGAQQVGVQLEQAERNQREQSQRIERVEERATFIETREREAGAIIAECQSIIRAVKERGTSQTE